MTNTDKLVALGRFMIKTAPCFADDVQFNTWARVGQMLTEVGTPFGKTLAEFVPDDLTVVKQAAAVVTGKASMPEQIVPVVQEPRRTRKPRMTQVMAKPPKPKAAAKSEGKRRGRPPGSKNKAR